MHRTIFRVTRKFAQSKQLKVQGLKEIQGVEITRNKLREYEFNNFNAELKQNHEKAIETKALNFERMENGKIIALESFQAKLQSQPIHNKFIDLAAIGFYYYNIEFAAFSYASMGALALYAAFLSLRVMRYTHYTLVPKIVRIKKLENGDLQIDFSADGSDIINRTDVVPRQQFSYGVSAPSNLQQVKNLGVWCKVNGEHALICGSPIVNNHVFHQIV